MQWNSINNLLKPSETVKRQRSFLRAMKAFAATKGLSKTEAAAILGIPRQTLTDWLVGRSVPKVERMNEVAKSVNESYDSRSKIVGAIVELAMSLDGPTKDSCQRP